MEAEQILVVMVPYCTMNCVYKILLSEFGK